MVFLSLYTINANGEHPIFDVLASLKANCQGRDLSAIIYEQNTNVSIPNLLLIVATIERILGEKITFNKMTMSADRFIAINHYLIGKMKKPFLISYPACNLSTGEIQIIDRDYQETFLCETLLAEKYLNEWDACNVSYANKKKIDDEPIFENCQPALLASTTLSTYLKQKKEQNSSVNSKHMLNIQSRVLESKHYIKQLNSELAATYLNEHPQLSFVLHPSRSKRDATDMVFTLSFKVPEQTKCEHIRFLVEDSELFCELFGELTPVPLDKDNLDGAILNIIKQVTPKLLSKHHGTQQRVSAIATTVDKVAPSGAAQNSSHDVSFFGAQQSKPSKMPPTQRISIRGINVQMSDV